jgi:polysaccharide export outer membrane protein
MPRRSDLRHLLLAALRTAALGVLLAPLSGQPEATDNYILRELDQVEIQVFGEPTLSKSLRIDGSGAIRMGLVGTVRLAGLSLSEAEAMLEQLYVEQRFLRDPQISIEVKEYAPLFIHVFGEVAKPGRVRLDGEDTTMPLIDLISAVGGFTGIAKSDSVRITRTSTDGVEIVRTVNAEALINGSTGQVAPEFQVLLPGDVVFVPERLF